MGIDSVLLSLRQGVGDGSYRFLCPSCLDTVEKPADEKIVALLLSVGVDVEGLDGEELGDACDLEAEILEERPAGPAFTVDDLISFHFLLQDDDRLARALAFG
jgi:hypothetical protein